MSVWKTRLHPVFLALGLACSMQVMAASKPLATPPASKSAGITPTLDIKEVQDEDYQRRVAVAKRTSHVFTLLGGELALQKGDPAMALASYMLTFERTKDPEVAERAMDIAISLHAYEQADAIYRRWQAIEPVPSAAQRRMAWVRHLIFGEVEQVRTGFADVFDNTNDEQRRRLFLLLAQSGVQKPELVNGMVKQVHQVAAKYPMMSEAVICDVIFSAYSGDEEGAVKALKRLAVLDSSIVPATELTLRLVSQQQPKVLNRFFEESNTAELSPMWQQLKLESLIHAGQNDKAYALLQKLLADNPDGALYLQAAFLSINQKAELPVTMGYLDKAYKYGTQEQQSRAAVVAAMRYADARKFEEARGWAAKIKSTDYAFDKIVLQASISASEGNWPQASQWVKQARQLPEQQGRFFTDSDLLRVQLFAIAKQKNPQQALAELNQLHSRISRQPESGEKLADILYQRAMVYADQLNQPEKAVADLRRFQELKPNDASGMNALGYTLLSLPKPDLEESFRWIQAAYHLEPESAAINDSMGWVYYLKGESQAALPYLEYAFKAFEDPEVAAHLGEVYWKLGRKDDAAAVFRKGLQVKQGRRELLLQAAKRLGISLNGTTGQ